MYLPRVLLVVCLMMFAFSAAARNDYQIPRVETSPVIDAVIDVGEWEKASTVELGFEISPGENVGAKIKTTVLMMEDGKFIYFAFIAKDPNPENILVFLRDRDKIFEDDYVGIFLDTFNDERRGFEFFVNVLGVQGDRTIDDTQGFEDPAWDAIWQSHGQLTNEGYIVEFAIPFSTLRFTPELPEQTWGITFVRSYPRSSKMLLSDHPANRDQDCTLCQASKLRGMAYLESSGKLEITPALTHIRNERKDLEGNGDWQSANSDTELGVDIRWAMTENWIMNVTLNPDFSQVEADTEQLNINTTFSLFFPESRPFFLDGAEYFSSSSNLVHTRNIAEPDFGLKLTGKAEKNSAGIIVARDEITSFLIPGSLESRVATLSGIESEVMVARYQRDISEKSNFGGLLTHRSGAGYHNTVASFDGKYFFSDFDSIDIQLMYSDSDNPLSIQSDFELAPNQSDMAYFAKFERKKRNYSLLAEYKNFGSDFRADMGFISRVDYKLTRLGGSYTWYGNKDNPWTKWGLYGDWDKIEDQQGQLIQEEYELRFNLTGPKQSNAAFGVTTRTRFYQNIYFDEDSFFALFEFKPWSNLTYFTYIGLGDQVDFDNAQLGESKLIEPSIIWQLSKHFDFRLSATYQELDVAGGRLFTANLYDTRLAYQFNVRSRLSLTIQSTDIDRDPELYSRPVDRQFKSVGTQLIYSYKVNPLTLIYLGYSDHALDNDRFSSLERTDKSIFAKFSYMWNH